MLVLTKAGLIDPFKTVGIVWQRVFPHLPGAPQQSHMEVLEFVVPKQTRGIPLARSAEVFSCPYKWVAQPWVQPLPAFPPSVLGVE